MEGMKVYVLNAGECKQMKKRVFFSCEMQNFSTNAAIDLDFMSTLKSSLDIIFE